MLRGRDSGAAEGRGRGGAALCSARRSCVARRLGIGAVLRGRVDVGGVRGGLKEAPGIWGARPS